GRGVAAESGAILQRFLKYARFSFCQCCKTATVFAQKRRQPRMFHSFTKSLLSLKYVAKLHQIQGRGPGARRKKMRGKF
ncbi:hypothetical protein, partial [Desulfovibrio sp.]|uniref:hypothetical protein n=1 Tax=Desulfovibrio sp. TaxID=885 RepID=UPI0023C69001